MLAKVAKKIPRAKGYLFMYTQFDGDGYCNYLSCSRIEVEIPDLIEGRKVRVKCAATGTPKKLVCSEEFSLHAQWLLVQVYKKNNHKSAETHFAGCFKKNKGPGITPDPSPKS